MYLESYKYQIFSSYSDTQAFMLLPFSVVKDEKEHQHTTLKLCVIHSICICLFGVLRRFQHCTGHITTGSWKGRGNQYI